ncbi:MAG: hypothetical protein J6Z49_07895 [Kiritimatiellae bacterium]|nr:hypothetical protein [Kiritimatiellia bacterium]
MKRFLFVTAALAATLSFAAGGKAKPPADPNPYAGYGKAMASVKGDPMAVEWQNQNKAAIEEATSDAALAAIVRDAASAKALLDTVKPNYATCPLKACQMAAVTQYVMRPGKAAERTLWADALATAFQNAADDSVKTTYLDQLRWCATEKQVAAIRKGCGCSKAVRDFADMVIREIQR